jgi:UDP-N-acetylmuramate dehydrogenase
MFKHEKGRYVIVRVDFKLEKGGKANIEYKDLKEYFAAKKINAPSSAEVREAVISIRAGKLPDWKLWGTAGSFFKNPVVSAQEYATLKNKYPDLPGFPEANGKIKLALAWILDNICHAKGMMNGNVGTYEKQALVFVAKPGATAAEVVELAQELMKRVKDATGVTIEGEVEWVN